MPGKSKKKTILADILTFVFLTVILMIFLRHLDENVFKLLAETEISMLTLLLFSCCVMILSEALIYRLAYADKEIGFSFSNAIDLACIQQFGKVAVITGGALPLQSFYLYKKGMMPGKSVGTEAAMYILKKISVMLYAAAALCFHWGWFSESVPGAFGYVIFSFSVCIVIVIALLLLSTSRRICSFACRMVRKLPSSGKWPARKEKLTGQIEAIYTEAQLLFHEKKKMAAVLLLNLAELFLMYCIPWAVGRMMNLWEPAFFQVQTMSAVMLLMAHTLPNIAGMGAPEFSFLTIFSGQFGIYTTTAMIYYRCATYYFPFILSFLKILALRKKLSGEPDSGCR